MTEIERIIASHEEAIKEGWIDTNECGDPFWDDFVKLVEYARSTLTPPDTQGDLGDAIYNLGISCNRLVDNAENKEENRNDVIKKAFAVVSAKDILPSALTRPSREAKLLEALKRIRVNIQSPNPANYSATDKIDAVLFMVNEAIAEAEGE